jgi:DNA-directed RNA polymerase specialized sigma24 family protein
MNLIDWLRPIGREWGQARRRLDTKPERWPESVGARIQDRIPHSDFREQRFCEVFVGEVLQFNLAFKALPEDERTYVYIHWVVQLPARKKCKELHISHQTYYGHLEMAHRKIANFLDSVA